MKHVVLITRPIHQAQRLSRLITATGATAFHLPVFEIQSLPFSPINPDQFDYFIFLSANAVINFFSRVEKNNFLTLKMIAIGSATKRALNDIGISNILCPSQFSSDAILQMPELQHVAAKNIAIICGENPKPLLQKILTERGALTHEIFCYRRQHCVYDMEEIFSQLIVNQIDVVVCASAKSLLQLTALFAAPTHRTWLLQKTLCVTNESMRDIAVKIGFHSMIVAENATDEAVSVAVTGVCDSLHLKYNHPPTQDFIMSSTESTKPQKSSNAIAFIAIIISIIAIGASAVSFYFGKMQVKNVSAAVTHSSLQYSDQLQSMQQQLMRMQKSVRNAPNSEVQKTFSDIANLAQSIQQLPMMPIQSPSSLQNTINAIKSVNEQLPWYKRILENLKSLKTLFIIRHLDHPAIPLIMPEQEIMAKQNILMQLNIAQWALLHHDKIIYQTALTTVSRWVSQYFAASDARNSILDQLTALTAVTVTSAQIQPALVTMPNPTLPQKKPNSPAPEVAAVSVET